METKVTSVSVYPIKKPLGKVAAFAKITINDCLHLNGLKVIHGINGEFVSYPNDPNTKSDEYRDLFFPITKELRDHIQSVVLEAYGNCS